MEQEKYYNTIVFSADVLREAIAVFSGLVERRRANWRTIFLGSSEWNIMRVGFPGEEWHYDSEEEFLADYRRNPENAHYSMNVHPHYKLEVSLYSSRTTVSVSARSREEIARVFDVFERHADASRIPTPPPPPARKPVVFVGHGSNPQWRDLKDHLHEQHGYAVETYEIGARAGHAIRDILESMLEKSSFGILVLTGEDHAEGERLLARQNVIHECGLFQGRLGFDRAIILLEEGTEEFSNIHGIHQVRFGTGRIKETFGDVLATLRREFGGA